MKKLAIISLLIAVAFLPDVAMAGGSKFLPAGGVVQTARAGIGTVQDEISLIQPPMPKNCASQFLRGRGPSGNQIVFTRNTCAGYFWGRSVTDYYDAGETETLGDGEGEKQFKVIYLRYPARANSNEPFRRILIDKDPKSAERCGTHILTPDELDRIFWEDRVEKSSGIGKMTFDIVSEIFTGREVWAEDNPLEGYYSYLEPTRPFNAAERTLAAAIFSNIAEDIRRAIDNGEYGAISGENLSCPTTMSSLPQSTAELIYDYAVWAASGLSGASPNPILRSYPRPFPQISWGRPMDTNAVMGFYGSHENMIVINEELLVDEYSFQVLFHEVVHAANNHTFLLRQDYLREENFLDEWLAELSNDLFYWRHPPTMQGFWRSVYANELYEMLMFDPYYLMVEIGLTRGDLFVPNLPRQLTLNEAMSLINTGMSFEVAANYYGVPLDPAINPCPDGFTSDDEMRCSRRFYDWLIPECTGHMEPNYEACRDLAPSQEELIEHSGTYGAHRDCLLDNMNFIPGCPDIRVPEILPPEARRIFNEALRRQLYDDTYLWEPYVHELVADIEALGGLDEFFARENFAVSCAPAAASVAAIHSSLNHDNVESNNIPHAPWAPENGIVGQPPSTTSRNLPESPPNFTAEPNERGYTEPDNFYPDCVLDWEDPYRGTNSPGATEGVAGAPASCYDWCWDHFPRGRDGFRCENMTDYEVWHQCRFTSRENVCQREADRRNEARRNAEEERRREEAERRVTSGGESDGPQRYDTPPNCRATVLNVEYCGNCGWDDEDGYSLGAVRCPTSQPGWQTCCPACASGYSGSAVCLACSGGDCVPTGSGGGGSGSGGGGSGGAGDSGGSSGGGGGSSGSGGSGGSGGGGGGGSGGSDGGSGSSGGSDSGSGGGSSGGSAGGAGGGGGGSSEEWGCCAYEDTVGQYCAICRWDGSEFHQESGPLTCPSCGDSGGVSVSDSTPDSGEWVNCGFVLADTDVDAIVDTCGFVYCPSELGCENVIEYTWAGICLFEPGTYVGNCLEE